MQSHRQNVRRTVQPSSPLPHPRWLAAAAVILAVTSCGRPERVAPARYQGPYRLFAALDNDTMQPDGIITIASPFDFATTIEPVGAAIDARDDTVWFGTLDFQARAQDQGVDIAPARMLLFGGPAPGAKAMAKAATIGLDGFCQKLLVWQDDAGATFASFNDFLALAERQGVPKSAALRVINHRLKSVFGAALQSE